MDLNRFMLECASICPETTHQKLESQRLYLTLFTMNLFVIFQWKNCVGVASTIIRKTKQATKLVFAV